MLLKIISDWIKSFTKLPEEPNSDDKAKRVILNCSMFLLAGISYTLLRINKDSLILSDALGSSAVSYLKLYLTLPGTFLAFYVIDYLIKRVSQDDLFKGVLTFFGSTVLAFITLIYPNKDKLVFSSEFINSVCTGIANFPLLSKIFFMKSILGPVSEAARNILMYPSSSLFFLIAELYGAIVLGMMIWSYFASTTSKVDAPKIFPLYTLATALANMIGGTVNGVLFAIKPLLNKLNISQVSFTNLAVVVFCALIIFLYNQSVELMEPEFKHIRAFKKKKKGSLIDSLKAIFSNTTLIMLFTGVVTYGITIGLLESQIKNSMVIFSDGNAEVMALINSTIIFLQGLLAFVMFFVSYNAMSTGNVITTALITPVSMLVFAFIFFLIAPFKPFSQFITPLLPSFFNPVALADRTKILASQEIIALSAILILIGGAVQVVSKGCKYLYFDNVKERSYVLLDYETRTIGKNAVDLAGSKIGKAGASAILTFGIFPMFGTDISSWMRVWKSFNIVGFVVISFLILMLLSQIKLANINDAAIKLGKEGQDSSNKNERVTQALEFVSPSKTANSDLKSTSRHFNKKDTRRDDVFKKPQYEPSEDNPVEEEENNKED